ncbi:RagB/SusD family nutrient uptake outer membrane protein [Flavihumibacter solisilvae]|uniref:Carbohydrate-binding protein SusD n=1 Tax=Flavihumibacter solisilvae TaxID=1349421 RepID=A0A0C1L3B3_9BACT|nr:RagB/SusD family nutrient uptake outer membrane protein [Flavihumibacter solisilvae]KIC94457.1 hypothetical protein OI18_11940 [Flavihumibacter solisilvae]
MKKINILTGLLCCLAVTSCKKDFLDGTKPEDKISGADVWKSPELARKVLNGAYMSLPAGHTYFMMMSATDEGVFQYNDLGTPYTHGLVTPTTLGAFDQNNWAVGAADWSWGAVYKNIRNIDIALANLNQVPFATQAEKDEAIADAHFLRGFSYYLLLAQFGGVPLYEKPVELGEDYNKPRNSFEETVNFIVADLDKAISLYDAGKIAAVKTKGDKGVAMAVKAKVLLYAASDLHNGTKNGTITSGYAHPELVGYTGGDPIARWQAAKDAAKAVIDLNRYHLYTQNADKVRNFEEIFVNGGDEFIFVRYFDKNINWYWQLGRTPFYNMTPGYGGWGVNSVLGNLVDAFEMSDGSKFSWSNPVHKANPYSNRDPRLTASILYEGTNWYPRASTENKVRVGNWASGSAPDALRTNYWLRKFSDLAKGPMDYDNQFEKCPAWPRLRYAEVLLNYAEACIELGQDAEARTYLNMIRQRAGMPDITESGDALKERYRNERRVELAFEEHRFFDVRRWLIGEASARDGYGVDVEYPTQDSYNNPTFKEVVIDGGRTWANKAYFIPITTDEMNKNKSLIQNPGY